jgi:hypothetical protein
MHGALGIGHRASGTLSGVDHQVLARLHTRAIDTLASFSCSQLHSTLTLFSSRKNLVLAIIIFLFVLITIVRL